MAKKREPKEYIIDCYITRRTQVIVIAMNEDEASNKCERGEWEAEDDHDIGETINWKIASRPKENK